MGCNETIKTRPTLVQQLIDEGILVINDGYRAKNSELSNTGIPFARAGNINEGFQFDGADKFPIESLDRVGFKISQPGDVVFTSKGTVGRFAFVKESTQRFVYAPQLCFWRSLDHSKLDPRWLYYWMHSTEFFAQYRGVAAQSDMAEYVSLRDQRRMLISIPSDIQQRTVANILSSLDDKIELNRRMNRALEETAQAIFRSWFVDFDPVKAKMRANELGRDPERAAMAALAGKLHVPKNADALAEDDFIAAEAELERLSEDQRSELIETAALFPAMLVDSELGLVPEGWGVKVVADIADFVNGRNFTKNATGTGRTVIRIAELNSGISGSTQFNEVEAQPENIATPDTILFAWSGSLGVHRWHGEEALINQHIFKVIPNNLPSWFAYFQLVEHMPFFRSVASHKAVTMGHIKRSHLSEALLAYPMNDSMLAAASKNIQPLYDSIHRVEVESRTLATLRDTLLPRLLSGEIRVREAETLAEDAC